MKIAVLLGGVGFDSQRRTIDGILDKALLDRANVYIFVCEGWKHELPSQYERGENNIYRLPDFEQYDGVILNSDTIHEAVIVEQVENKIKEAKVPCVDLNVRGRQSMIVEMENRIGMEEITQHLIAKHHAKRIYFISGPVYSDDAGVRMQTFQETMMANHLGWDKKQIYYGDYSFESGKRAVRKFLSESSEIPDAIIAVNDEMAVGAILELREAGYLVPEDVIVTGYDDSSIAEYNHPRLTSVRRGEYEAGQIAYDKIAAVIRGEEVEQHTVIQGKAVFAASCGCAYEGDGTSAQIREKYIGSYVSAIQDMEIIRNSAAEFTGLTDLDGLLGCLEKYIRSINIEYFYLCLCGNTEDYYRALERSAKDGVQDKDSINYGDKIWVPFAYEKGEINSYGEYHRRYLLPEECAMRRTGAFYTIMPLHFQSYSFGYCVAGNYRRAVEGGFYQSLILNLDNALESIRKQSMMEFMVQKLKRMWITDELTGLYNREGFHQCAEDIIIGARKEDKTVGVIFVDVDGLTEINGVYGHEQGDALIKVMASVMEQILHGGELLGRYGGDEFVVLITDHEKNDVEKDIVRIRRAIDNYNMLNVRPYSLNASIGYALEESTGTMELDELLKQAYDAMYQEKKSRQQA